MHKLYVVCDCRTAPTSSEELISPIFPDDSQISLTSQISNIDGFTWQKLVACDRQVLVSVEDSLKNPSERSPLLHSCDFFNDVMLQDFPSEVFVQRPSIVFVSMYLFLLLQVLGVCDVGEWFMCTGLSCNKTI